MKLVIDLILLFNNTIIILLENKNKNYAVQTRSQLKNSTNIDIDKNQDNIKNKLIRNIQVEAWKATENYSRNKIAGTN